MMFDINMDKINWKDMPEHLFDDVIDSAEATYNAFPEPWLYEEEPYSLTKEEFVQNLIDEWEEKEDRRVMEDIEAAGRAVNLYRHGIDRDLAKSLQDGEL